MSYSSESIQQLLNSENYGDRIKGINQLRQIDPKLAFTMIQPLVTDENARIRYAAVSQFDPLGNEDLDTALVMLRDRLFNDSESDVRAAAADAIGGLKLVTAFDDLEQVYDSTSDWLIQLSIISALGEMGEPRAFGLLQKALSSNNSLVKTAAVSAFGELGDQNAVALLIPFVDDEDWQIRYRLAQALGHLGGAEATATLNRLAQDEMEQVAAEAKNNLSK
jgi:HEAT repeat protein